MLVLSSHPTHQTHRLAPEPNPDVVLHSLSLCWEVQTFETLELLGWFKSQSKVLSYYWYWKFWGGSAWDLLIVGWLRKSGAKGLFAKVVCGLVTVDETEEGKKRRRAERVGGGEETESGVGLIFLLFFLYNLFLIFLIYFKCFNIFFSKSLEVIF